MIELFFFFTISVFNGVEDIDWDLRFYTDIERMTVVYCKGTADDLAWGCADYDKKQIHLLLGKVDARAMCPYGPCTVIAHEILHATYFEMCAKYIGVGLIAPITEQYCYKIANWHD